LRVAWSTTGGNDEFGSGDTGLFPFGVNSQESVRIDKLGVRVEVSDVSITQGYLVLPIGRMNVVLKNLLNTPKFVQFELLENETSKIMSMKFAFQVTLR
jgi:hypothetical protein